MLHLARENQEKSGIANVEFLKGEIESIPLPDNSIDVIISNCAINLSADKNKVLSEAFRAPKPGDCLAVSDVVTRGDMPAGSTDVDLEPSRIYRTEDARAFLTRQEWTWTRWRHRGRKVPERLCSRRETGLLRPGFLLVAGLKTHVGTERGGSVPSTRQATADAFDVKSAGTRVNQSARRRSQSWKETGIEISGHTAAESTSDTRPRCKETKRRSWSPSESVRERIRRYLQGFAGELALGAVKLKV